MKQAEKKDVNTVREKSPGYGERQRRAPLYEHLDRHAQTHPHPFHVPGHKMGRSFDSAGIHRFSDVLPLDVTEISGMDDLHDPAGVIAEAQALAAEAFGAEETRFLIGGSTVGNMALIMSVCRPGDKILVQRNCHKSVFHGMMLARAHPVYIVPAVDPDSGVAAGIRREDVERALQVHPDAKAVFITNPTYYGMGIDLAKMAAVVHRFGIPLLVDEAHGSHYGFHSAFPLSAMQCGVDAAVQSTHKMTAALTMSSMLHIQGPRIDRERLARSLAILQSSSPSYLLMASLDLARRHLVHEAGQEWSELLPQLERLRERIRSLAWLELAELGPSSVYTTMDPLKLMLILRTDDLDGYGLQQLLEESSIYPELADTSHVLLAASSGTRAEDLHQLMRVLESLPCQSAQSSRRFAQAGMVSSSFLREQAMPIHEAMDAERISIPLEQAEGHIAGEMIIPYPPGIPLLAPGERIDAPFLQQLTELRKSRVRFQGVRDASLQTIQVVKYIRR
ncbi:aminotransferase class V-fold PLP-dependent enzyme [Brevibacillus composti]|uniref:Aminotransferase class V-fold PLP-dependent enzyme n=1 Tax=Brevibacillus composti TaxID=2796470 RepID=A0A7T5JNU1_9BACL|nr:aminotransferase class V-fold PLP-dependent enzyme [Brevibacillus composti]QQE74534.1 aminotransferase class V-fold PLP-dependent enzyme [Brevibacillus composti]QUO41616.1 aminotransferase class V-fold PLP-dependent enzyme [Brevibacillus composti]